MKKSLSLLLGVLILVAAFLACGEADPTSGSTTPSGDNTPAATSQATQKPQSWKVTHTFIGNGAKKTASFTVPDHWKLSWECQGTDGIDALLYIGVYNDDGTPLDISAASTTCKAGSAKTKGESEQRQGGKVYLDINSGIDWKITVSELK